MNLKKIFKLHKIIVNAISDDLVVSIILDNDEYFISVSVHKSKMEMKTTREVQTCKLSPEDLNRDINVVANEIIELYKSVIYKPKDKKDDI